MTPIGMVCETTARQVVIVNGVTNELEDNFFDL